MSTQKTEFPVAASSSGFDFDVWANLAAKDEDAFDRAKRDLLMQAVADAPESQREQLVALVGRLMAPTGPATGMERAVAAHNLMMQSMHSLQNEMLGLRTELGEAPESAKLDRSMAQFMELTTIPR